MSQTTKTAAPPTSRQDTPTIANQTTTPSPTTATSNKTIQGNVTTTPTTIASSTSTLSSSTLPDKPSTTTTDGTNMAMVGGLIGGAVVVILIFAVAVGVFIWWRRRRRKQKARGNVRLAPGKDELDRKRPGNQYEPDPTSTASTQDRTNPYMNLDDKGVQNENTDPSVGADGYLKKTADFFRFKISKKKKRKKKNREEIIDLPIYGNETQDLSPIERQQSLPASHAPPPPSDVTSSASYVTGRPGQGTERTTVSEDKDYVNIEGQKKGEVVFGVSPKPSHGRKKQGKKKKSSVERTYINQTKNQQGTNKSDGAGYYNTRSLPGAGTGLETYENLEAQAGGEHNPNFPSEIYENP